MSNPSTTHLMSLLRLELGDNTSPLEEPQMATLDRWLFFTSLGEVSPVSGISLATETLLLVAAFFVSST
jgi:hypothetical protein